MLRELTTAAVNDYFLLVRTHQLYTASLETWASMSLAERRAAYEATTLTTRGRTVRLHNCGAVFTKIVRLHWSRHGVHLDAALARQRGADGEWKRFGACAAFPSEGRELILGPYDYSAVARLAFLVVRALHCLFHVPLEQLQEVFCCPQIDVIPAHS
jgi:hypothetical protein